MWFSWTSAIIVTVVIWLFAAGVFMRIMYPRFTAAVQILVIIAAFVLILLWLICGFQNAE